jgi:predicted anti-sigma-YlaC factor YlaD
MTRARGGDRDEHAAYRMLVAASIDGSIAPDDDAVLAEHLETCAACRADLRSMIEDHRWLAAPQAALVPDPRVRAAVRAASRSGEMPRVGSPLPGWASLAAAAVVVAVVGGFAWWSQRLPAIGPGSGHTTAPGPTCAPIPAGLTSWWPMDGNGTDVAGTHDLVLHGNATFAPGRVGSALALDGLNSYASAPHSEGLMVGAQDFTVQLWVRFENTDGEQVLIEQWKEGDTERRQEGWTLTKLETGQLLATSGSPEGGSDVSVEHGPLEKPGWHHVALRRSGRLLSIYVDGRLASQEERSFETADLSVDVPLVIGRRGDSQGFFLRGQIDDVQLAVGRAFAYTEIRRTFEAGAAGTCHS